MTDKKEKLQELARLLEEKQRRKKYNQFTQVFPDEGPLSRDKYPKQLDFFKAGKRCKQRAMIAANRTGKSFAGGYEMVCHLTGLYPDWWEGYRFDRPVSAWCAGVSNEATKDVLQQLLLGDYADIGSGMIPKDLIVGNTVTRPGVPEAVLTVRVKHFTDGIEDGVSTLGFKSYDQKRPSFQGTAKDVIWLDEEPRDYGIYSECITRTMTTGGMIYCTFTPLFGLSEVVESFMPGGKIPEGGVSGRQKDKYIVQIDWSEVPHLDQADQEALLSTYTPYERDARTKGIPQLGSGAIYPILEDEILVDPFEIPVSWPRVYGMDVGWERTAAVWAAINPDTHQVFLYSEHYRGKAEPPIHAAAILARGDYIPGAIDPNARSSGQADGSRLYFLYEDLGLDLVPAENAREAGILKVWQMLSTGQLKVFKTLQNWLAEFRVYRRDEKGNIVKKNDHLMDATRYLVMSGIQLAEIPPDPDAEEEDMYRGLELGENEITGY